MTELLLSYPLLPLGQANSWMTAWLTPIWFLAAGIAMGLAVLAALVLVFRVLSNVPVWEQLSHGPAGHVVAAMITGALAAVIWYLLPPAFIGSPALNEPLLLGIALVLLCSIVGWGVVFCCSKQPAQYSFVALGEGVAGYLGITALVIVFVGAAAWGVGAALGTPIVADPKQTFSSIPLLFSTGEAVQERVIPAAPATGESPFVAVDVPIDLNLLDKLVLESDRSVILGDAASSAAFSRVPIRLGAGDSITWNRRTQKIEELPIPYRDGTQLHVQNVEIDPLAGASS